jgi:hypothetical protein
MTKNQKTNRDHAKKTHRPMVEEEVIASQLSALLIPAITSQENYYRQLGLRGRILNLPLMVAAVSTLLWRDVTGVTELTRMLAREGFLWCRPTIVTQQAMSQRFLSFPACLFEGVFKNLLPSLRTAWYKRNQRPLPQSIQFALTKFSRIWIVDSSTLEALFCKHKSWEDIPLGQFGGKMATVIDLMTRLPVEVWFLENPRPSDVKVEEKIRQVVPANTLLLLDRGFYHFSFWLKLIERDIHLITRLKKGASIKLEQVFTKSYDLRDSRIRLGSGTAKTPFVTLRLIEVRSGKIWHSYLTSVLDPHVLPPYVVADLYRRGWRIEDAFNTVKRLLGLSYLWTGSLNGIQLQIFGIWIFYALLVDLGDAVADQLSLPIDSISLEMIYRSFYHFYVAHQKGKATDPPKYFAAPENRDLGIVKSQRKPNVKLIVAPFPDRQRGKNQYFFDTSSQIPLTTAIQA